MIKLMHIRNSIHSIAYMRKIYRSKFHLPSNNKCCNVPTRVATASFVIRLPQEIHSQKSILDSICGGFKFSLHIGHRIPPI